MQHIKKIEQAQKALEVAALKAAKGRLRPQYLFAPPANWMNDPNGLVYYKGEYHIFYQHNPYSEVWAQMHWGHATSTDLMHWQHKPVALAPSEEYDDYETGGCFSGSAVEKEGKLYLFYTAAAKVGDDTVQTQCVAISDDGIVFKKYKRNPVIKAYPDGDGSLDFRDPKVFLHEGVWYMIVGTSLGGATTGGDGRIVLYKSADLLNWDYCGVIIKSDGQRGTMWECPDMFMLDGKWVVIFSPMYYKNIKTWYMVGEMDFTDYKFTPEVQGEIDYGIDYYAMQTFEDDQNRRIMIAWHDDWTWDTAVIPTSKEGWRGLFSLPRQLYLTDNNRLAAKPVSEAEALRKNCINIGNIDIDENITVIEMPDAEAFEMKFKINTAKTTAGKFELHIRSKGEKYSKIYFDFKEMKAGVNREHSDGLCTGYREAGIEIHNGQIPVCIFSDTCAFDTFINDGETNFAFNIFPKDIQTGASAVSLGGITVVEELAIYTLSL